MTLTLDDRKSRNLIATCGSSWRAISDTVMGGVSTARLTTMRMEEKNCIRLTGRISLENNGGFVQTGLDLNIDSVLDGSSYSGIEIEVLGNSETYNIHLRTKDTRIVWQSYRASFLALPCWQTIRPPFGNFQPHRTDLPLDTRALRRLGVVAIGREMLADICIAKLALYR